MAGAGGSELPGKRRAAPLGRPFPEPSGAGPGRGAQGSRRRGVRRPARAFGHGPLGLGSVPQRHRPGIPRTGGGGAALTRTTSNRVPPAPLSADANAGTPDLASGRRK